MRMPGRFLRVALVAAAVAPSACRGQIVDIVPGGSAEGCGPAPAAGIRLSDRQFRNTIATLFPFPVDVGTKYPRTPYRQDFTTSIAANEVLYNDIESFADTAESIALQAVGHLDQLLPCTPAGNESACARAFIDAFAPRAYRRPLAADERQTLVSLYDGSRTGAGALGFDLGIAAVIAAVLQSPQFLYRVEAGAAAGNGLLRLTGYEIASRLSYLYWEGPPDDALLEAARSGALASREGVEAEASRLLDDPRAREGAWRFFSEWLGFGDEVYSGRVDPALAADFAEETRRFVGSVVFEGTGTLADLLQSNTTFVNRRLAAHYGLPYDGSGDTDWRQVTVPDARAAGVLDKAQVAVAHSAVGETSVVQRGKFIYERLLCQDLGTPPPGAQSMNPVLPPDATPRARVEARNQIATCAACHQQLDFAGLGMEDVDALGLQRARYASGAPVDATGILRALPGSPTFQGTAALAHLLAAEPSVGSCLARQWYRYASSHRESEEEASCQVAHLQQRFADSGGNLRALLLGIAGSDAFVYRRPTP
jgi:hypothetical protein